MSTESFAGSPRRVSRRLTRTHCSYLSFLLTAGAWDKAYEWTTLSASDRATIKSQYNAAGIRLMVAAFGSSDVPTSAGQDPVALANTIAAWVRQWGLDGVDIDYEVRSLLDVACFVGAHDASILGFQRYGRRNGGELADLLH